jgi:hypothetical protein
VSDPHQLAFRRAILALAGGSCDDRIVRLSADLARPTHGELVGVHVVEIGWSMPLDADVAARSEEAQQILDHAELEAEQLKSRLEPVLLQAREGGGGGGGGAGPAAPPPPPPPTPTCSSSGSPIASASAASSPSGAPFPMC